MYYNPNKLPWTKGINEQIAKWMVGMLDDRLKVISLVKIYEKGSHLFVVVKTSWTVSLNLHLFPSKHSFMIDDQQSNLNQQSLVSSCLSKWRPNIWRIRSKSFIDFSFLWHTNPPCSNIVWRAGPRRIWGSEAGEVPHADAMVASLLLRGQWISISSSNGVRKDGGGESDGGTDL